MGLIRLLNSSLGAKKETTNYTYEAPATTDGITMRLDMEVNLNREFLEDDTMNGSLSHAPSEPGMWGDDLGCMIPVYARSGGTAGSIPEFSVLMENVFGSQEDNTDDEVDDSGTDATTTIFKLDGAGAVDLVAGQLILVDVDGAGTLEVAQVISYVSPTLTVWPPLSTTPTDGGTIYAGTNFMLLDESFPYFSVLAQFEADKHIKYKGCLVSTMEATFEPGQRVPINFTVVAQGLEEYGHATHTNFKDSLDSTTRYLVCLGVDLSALFAGTTTGTPTTTSTILAIPSFGVAIGDEILIDAGLLTTPTACTFSNATEIVNDVLHGLSNGNRVKFFDDGVGGVLPAELSEDIIYYVVNKNDDDFQVALTSGGSAVEFTDDGTGTFTYSVWTKSTGNWETLAISNVSGNAGENTTITHATATNRADSGDTVYVRRKKCAGVGDSLTITMEREITPVNCMADTYGKAGIEVTGRMVTVAKTPFWQDWQEFLTRDNAVGSELMVYMGTETEKIMVWYLPNIQNTEVSITGDTLMKNDVTAVANKDTRIGAKNEIVCACF